MAATFHASELLLPNPFERSYFPGWLPLRGASRHVGLPHAISRATITRGVRVGRSRGKTHRPVASLYLLLRRACSMSDEKGACVRLACASSATIKNCRLTRRFVCRAADDLDQMGWTLGKELGAGHFAKVKLVTRKTDGQLAACKIIKKPRGAHARAQKCCVIMPTRPVPCLLVIGWV